MTRLRLRDRLVAACAAVLLGGGCGTQTIGDVRRRDLFHALLMAWVLGLALIWRWWARPRPGERDPD